MITHAIRIKDWVREHVAEAFLEGGEARAVRDQEDLMELLDSLQILRMVSDVAHQFVIEVGNDDLTPENFGSVEKIAEFIARKQQL